MVDRPVWLNQDENGPQMYTVVVEFPGNERLSFLVFTAKGLMHAKEMGESHGGRCVKSQKIPFPVLTPNLQEIEHIVSDSSALITKRSIGLQMFRFTLRVEGQEDPRVGFVWTSKGRRFATGFIERSLMGKVVQSYRVQNPILWDMSDAPAALAEA